jgi:adenylosuccinate synthase
MTTLADSMEEFFLSQVIIIFMIYLDILPNGEEMRMLPVGIQHSNKTKSILGNGVIVDAKHMLNDLNALSNNGIHFQDRLYVSNR